MVPSRNYMLQMVLLSFLIPFGTLSVGSPSVFAQDKSAQVTDKPESKSAAAPAAIDFAKMAAQVVEVVDENGKAIEGATVYPYAMRAKENANGHGYWNDKLIGPPKMEATDASGKTTIHYPVNIGAPAEPRTTGSVTFSVRHTDFVSTTVHFDLGPEIARVEMKAGCEIRLTAVDENGSEISKFAVLMAGRLAPDYWDDDPQGGRRTRAASDGTWQTMLVAPQAEGPLLFSGVLPLRVRPDQEVKIRNVKLTPGTQVIGKLSDNVPRPIKSGFAIVTCAPKPAENSYAEENPSLVWHDWVEINEDGTFELESVPRGGEMQIIAICDDWLAKTIPPAGNGFFTQGQLYQLDKDQPRFECTVEMEPTGTVELTVLDSKGQPLAEGEVGSSPNQLYLKGGSNLLGSRYRSIDGVKSQLLPPLERQLLRSSRERTFPFWGKLVDGKITLKGLPIGPEESLSLIHPELVFKGSEDGDIRFKLESPEPKSMTLKAVLPEANKVAETLKVLEQAGDALKAAFKAIEPKAKAAGK